MTITSPISGLRQRSTPVFCQARRRRRNGILFAIILQNHQKLLDLACKTKITPGAGTNLSDKEPTNPNKEQSAKEPKVGKQSDMGAFLDPSKQSVTG